MSEPARRIAVTGAAGYIGNELVKRLASTPGVDRVLAIDIRPMQDAVPECVDFAQQDIAKPFDHLLSANAIDTVVHLAYILRPGHNRAAIRKINVGGTANLLTACANAKVKKIVYLSSTSVYGAHPDNPELLTEDAPTRPVRGFQYSENKAQAEQLILAYSKRRPGVVTTVLRACPVMGPGADNFIARAFLKPFLVAAGKADPPMQLLHEADLSSVLARSLAADSPGVYNVAGEGTIRWPEMAAMLKRKVFHLPPGILYPATDLLWSLRMQNESPACGLDFIRYRWTADTEKVKREMGITFKHTSREAWQAFARRRAGPP
ncbi:MAG: NAD-dependent epimerase/dehydratase family protein [SAR202 cluster bacterium]|nr:NAD-dependent epimerase/dehydratase family protein [SAR202 cluster bacterium]